jgi:preprotein translocase subunit SecA
MEKVGSPKDEALVHPMVTSSIERAQKRVEMQNFSIRKHLIEYDDVMNKQRTVIYAMRNEILDSGNIYPKYREFISEVTDMLVSTYTDEKSPSYDWDLDGLMAAYMRVFLDKLPINEDISNNATIRDIIEKSALSAFDRRQDLLGPEIMRGLMSWALLTTIDMKWKEHLQVMDTLQEGINLRAYAQKDPLIEYKKEGFETFAEMLDELRKETLIRFFHTQVQIEPKAQQLARERLQIKHESVKSFSGAPPTDEDGSGSSSAGRNARDNDMSQSKGMTIRNDAPKVGRNDPCPCGSGKKFKQCCGK